MTSSTGYYYAWNTAIKGAAMTQFRCLIFQKESDLSVTKDALIVCPSQSERVKAKNGTK